MELFSEGQLENGMKKRTATTYVTENITLYHADFFDIIGNIEKSSVDMVFTDPPFELTGGGMKNGKLNYAGGEIFSNCGFSTKNVAFSRWIPEVYRILKNERYFYAMSNDRNLFPIHEACMKSGFKFCELLVLDKKMTVPSSYFPKRAEFILMYRKGGYRRLHFTGATVIEAKLPRGRKKRHPTEKPVPMIEHLVRCSTLENEVCFDPFMGSCPVGEACIKAKRRFIGSEIEKRWFMVSLDRIREALCG